MKTSKKEKSKKPDRRFCKFMLFLCVYVLTVYITVTSAALISALSAAGKEKAVWENWQAGYIGFLEKSYRDDETFSKVDEADFYTSSMRNSYNAQTKLNQLRYLATHNSYKTGLTPETGFLYRGPLAAFAGRQYDYVFDTVTAQFNQGIRSIELDVNKTETADGFKIECFHGRMEPNSTMVDFGKGLEEMNMWLNRNPNATPVIVLIEPKNGEDFDLEAFQALDKMLFETYENKLITPAKLLGGCRDFDELREKDAYPAVDSLRGGIMFVLHEKASLKTYLERDPHMTKSAMTVALEYTTVMKKHPEYSKFSCMLIVNQPLKHADRVADAISKNYMVRTRLDKYAVVKDKVYEAGLASNANILSTDYPPFAEERLYPYPSVKTPVYDYTAVLYERGKTLTLRH